MKTMITSQLICHICLKQVGEGGGNDALNQPTNKMKIAGCWIPHMEKIMIPCPSIKTRLLETVDGIPT